MVYYGTCMQHLFIRRMLFSHKATAMRQNYHHTQTRAKILLKIRILKKNSHKHAEKEMPLSQLQSD